MLAKVVTCGIKGRFQSLSLCFEENMAIKRAGDNRELGGSKGCHLQNGIRIISNRILIMPFILMTIVRMMV